jgi:hypothetical protein
MLLMSAVSYDGPPLYRVWIVHYQDWRPHCWNEVPPQYRAVELAVGGCLSQDAAAHWLEGYNAAMLSNEATLFDEARLSDDDRLSDDAKLWAVAVAVQLRYEGDLAPGEIVSDRDRNYVLK